MDFISRATASNIGLFIFTYFGFHFKHFCFFLRCYLFICFYSWVKAQREQKLILIVDYCYQYHYYYYFGVPFVLIVSQTNQGNFEYNQQRQLDFKRTLAQLLLWIFLISFQISYYSFNSTTLNYEGMRLFDAFLLVYGYL